MTDTMLHNWTGNLSGFIGQEGDSDSRARVATRTIQVSAKETGPAYRQIARRVNPLDRLVHESHLRCRAYGLSADSVRPRRMPAGRGDSQVAATVDRVIDERRDELERSGMSLHFTDSDGVIRMQWIGGDELGRHLSTIDVCPGFSVSESVVGTNSATALLVREPILVHGSEHFAHQFHDLTTGGMAIVHPISHRMLGGLHLVGWNSSTSPMALSWLLELVSEVERQLEHSSSRNERLLMDSFLRENRDSRHPVVALNKQTILTNAAAANLLGATDQAILSEHASRVLTGSRPTTSEIEMSTGLTLKVSSTMVRDRHHVAGVIMRLKRISAENPTRPLPAQGTIPGLAGSGARWQAMARQITTETSRSILLVGDRGTGKAAIARAVSTGRATCEIDATELSSADAEVWIRRINELVDEDTDTVILTHAHLLDDEIGGTVLQTLSRLPKTMRVIATSSSWPSSNNAAQELLGAFEVIVEVPLLRDRSEDIPELVTALSAQRVATRGGAAPKWMPDAVQALTRIEWPKNVTSLQVVVNQVLSRVTTGYVGVRDLPPHVAVEATGRRLSELERAEVKTILQAMQKADGNKHKAAEALGIARSTLYRKIRSLSIDLDVANF